LFLQYLSYVFEEVFLLIPEGLLLSYFLHSILFQFETLTGNTGGKIHAVASNISILGAGGLTVAGNATLGTLTISGPGGPTGNLVTGFITDVGGNVVPTILGVVDLAGGNNITVSGSVLNTATFHLTGTTDHAVQLETLLEA